MWHGWSGRFNIRLVIEICASERDWNEISFVEDLFGNSRRNKLAFS